MLRGQSLNKPSNGLEHHFNLHLVQLVIQLQRIQDRHQLMLPVSYITETFALVYGASVQTILISECPGGVYTIINGTISKCPCLLDLNVCDNFPPFPFVLMYTQVES